MLEVWGDRQAFLCREATKLHEEYRRATLRELLVSLRERDRVRGEIVLVVAGAGEPSPTVTESPEALVARLRAQGQTRRQAVKEAAARVAGTRLDGTRLPAGVMNAPSIVDELRHHAKQFRPGRPAHVGYDPSFRLTNFHVGHYKIELIAPNPGADPGFLDRFFAKRGEGFHHISLDVDRLEPVLAALERDGVRIADRGRSRQGRQTAFISPRSAFGVLIQFWEHPEMAAATLP
jgi:hypothetical protein